jgi:hypothetical protein
MARTTISLEDHLLISAKKAAARNGQSLAAFVEDAVREVLSRRRERPARKAKLPTAPGAPRPGVNLDTAAELLELMEGR